MALKNKKLTEEHKRKIGLANSIALKGKWFPNQFQKGSISWLKGTKGIAKPNSTSFKKGHPVFIKRKGIYKICFICKNKFYVTQSLKRIKYCSYKCSGIASKGRPAWNKGMIGIFIKEKAANWQGGKSFEEYGAEFDNSLKEQIRFRDNYKCQLCGCSQIENGKQLEIHHIDYNKKNNQYNNFIALCMKCHRKTNGKREYWKNYLINFNDLFKPIII